MQVSDIKEALKALEEVLEGKSSGQLVIHLLSLQCPDRPSPSSSLSLLIPSPSPLGPGIPGTTEVSPKLRIPVDPLVRYLQEKHGLHQEGGSDATSAAVLLVRAS